MWYVHMYACGWAFKEAGGGALLHQVELLTLELVSLVSWADPAPVTLHPLPPQPRVLSTRSHAHLFTGWLMQALSPTEPSPQSFV